MFQILVVEDDRALNRTVCSFLNNSGYRAVGCLDANEAYDALYEGVFDLIVSDIMMPGTDGYEFARSVRDTNQNIPILFMTARDDIASKQRGFRIGVDDYMVKPIDLDELFLRIGALLQSPGLSEEKRMEYVRGVTDGTRRLSEMMTNILKLNRLENQKIYPQTTRFDLAEQLCECLLQYESVWEDKKIEIETELALGIVVQADRELLSLVWNNLLSNAFKFTPDGGRVQVCLEEAGEYALVRVRDTGCGMSPEVGAHIFEKFYQGDTSHSVQGNGLGLALVKRVVDILRGEIHVQSVLGQGSTFTVKFPRLAPGSGERQGA